MSGGQIKRISARIETSTPPNALKAAVPIGTAPDPDVAVMNSRAIASPPTIRKITSFSAIDCQALRSPVG